MGFWDKFKSDGWAVRYHSMLNICGGGSPSLMEWARHGISGCEIGFVLLWVAEFIFMHNCFLFVKDSKSIMNYYVYLCVLLAHGYILFEWISVLLRKLCSAKRRLKNFCSVSVCDMFVRFFYLFFFLFPFKNGNHSVLKGELGQSE